MEYTLWDAYIWEVRMNDRKDSLVFVLNEAIHINFRNLEKYSPRIWVWNVTYLVKRTLTSSVTLSKSSILLGLPFLIIQIKSQQFN